MDAINESLIPLARQMFEHFKTRCKVEVDLQINVDGSIYESKFITPYTVFVDGDCFFGATFEDAFKRAKEGYKPKDLARIAAAEKLRKQAAAIESGEAPIPQKAGQPEWLSEALNSGDGTYKP